MAIGIGVSIHAILFVVAIIGNSSVAAAICRGGGGGCGSVATANNKEGSSKGILTITLKGNAYLVVALDAIVKVFYTAHITHHIAQHITHHTLINSKNAIYKYIYTVCPMRIFPLNFDYHLKYTFRYQNDLLLPVPWASNDWHDRRTTSSSTANHETRRAFVRAATLQ